MGRTESARRRVMRIGAGARVDRKADSVGFIMSILWAILSHIASGRPGRCGVSGAELTKVMVHVPVRPPEPGGLRHLAENWMRRPVETLLSRRDELQERLELGDVSGKVD